MPACGPEQVLVRVDALGLCASDAKMVRMGQDYPLFFPRDFAAHPARLGHEAALTVIEVGERWRDRYWPGQRLGVQASVYNDGRRTIFGVDLPGAMTQYLALDEAVLAGDAGSYVFPVPDSLTYVDIALLEPWACVDVGLYPRAPAGAETRGTLWIDGRPGRPLVRHHEPTAAERPSRPDRCAKRVGNLGQISTRRSDRTQCLRQPLLRFTSGLRPTCNLRPPLASLWDSCNFDDIILLDPGSAEVVAQAIDCLAHGGLLTWSWTDRLDGPVTVDVGRLHYEPLSITGCTGPDIAAAYGVVRNRSELRPGGVTLIVGVGGTLGACIPSADWKWPMARPG